MIFVFCVLLHRFFLFGYLVEIRGDSVSRANVSQMPTEGMLQCFVRSSCCWHVSREPGIFRLNQMTEQTIKFGLFDVIIFRTIGELWYFNLSSIVKSFEIDLSPNEIVNNYKLVQDLHFVRSSTLNPGTVTNRSKSDHYWLTHDGLLFASAIREQYTGLEPRCASSDVFFARARSNATYAIRGHRVRNA